MRLGTFFGWFYLPTLPYTYLLQGYLFHHHYLILPTPNSALSSVLLSLSHYTLLYPNYHH